MHPAALQLCKTMAPACAFLLSGGFDTALLEASVMVREKLQALRSKTEAWRNRAASRILTRKEESTG